MTTMPNDKSITEIDLDSKGTKGHYAVDLPDTDAALDISAVLSRDNVIGQYAMVRESSEGVFEGIRDPLGIGKMFYTASEDGVPVFSSQWRSLLPLGTPIFSLPRGQHVRLTKSGERIHVKQLAPVVDLSDAFDNSEIKTDKDFDNSPQGSLFKALLKARLDSAFKTISVFEDAGFKIYIALSGGLDSAIIANKAVEHLKAPVACTLDLGKSEDAEKSALITDTIGIQQEIFKTNEAEILDAIKESPVLCQDYRDFNVHCTALNILLAKNIRQLSIEHGTAPGKAIVLTGDTMNELTCDYHAEEVDGTIYYRLPRVNAKMLQQMLIGGLDTSDRELLPFQHYGLSCIQPYAAAYDLYTALPQNVLEIEDIKRSLNGHLVPPKVMSLLPKSKLRAQVGSKESMGVLGLCHHRGITEKTFLEDLIGSPEASKQMVPITMGRWETETFK